jgi:hypothetical protein
MAGQVFTFNIFSEEMTVFSVNGLPKGPIPAWSDGTSSTRFTPAAVAVDRQVNMGTGVFFNGENRIILQWPSGIFTFTFTIDGDRYPVSQNLVLTIMQKSWQFIDSFGAAIDEGVLKPGTALLLQEAISGAS